MGRMVKRGLILDRYKPLGKAGAGGFGTVQAAWDTRIQRKVAIKCIQLSEADLLRASLPGADMGGGEEPGEAYAQVGGKFEGASSSAAAGANDHAGAAAPAGASASTASSVQALDDIPPWEDLPDEPFEDLSDEYPGEFPNESTADDGQLGEWVSPFRRGAASQAANPAAGESVSLTSGDADLVHTLARVPGLDEARTAAMLTDANIVTVYDFEIRDATAYLIMEYVEGMTLTEVLRDHDDELTLDVAAAVFAGVAHALEVAHESNVLHLDIKPDNILINEKGQVKVTDFGLATLADAAGYGKTGGGTIGYMPLEQMRSESLDARCDEWALASATYEMLAGENPFFAPDLQKAQEVIEDAELVLPSLCWDELPEQADDVLFVALDPDREERYESIEEFAGEMEPLLGDAREGKAQLVDIVCGPEEEEPEPEEPEPRIPLRERITPFMLRVASRACGCAGSALLAFWALSEIPATAGLTNPLFWGIGALVALAGALRPHLGALLGFASLSAALIAQSCPAGGCILLAATIAWWWLLGRHGDSLANTALAAPIAGAVCLGPFAPLTAGLSLRVLPAMGTAAFQALAAFSLASFGSGSLLGWNTLFTWGNAANTTAGMMPADIMFAMILQPGTWVVAISWVVAAGICSLCCKRPTRAFAIAGVVLAVVILLLGVVGAAGCASAWKDAMPDAVSLAGVIISGVVAVAVCTLFPDPEFASDEDFDED
jgi:eukaryotic-like serine/threonine-protein kinase